MIPRVLPSDLGNASGTSHISHDTAFVTPPEPSRTTEPVAKRKFLEPTISTQTRLVIHRPVSDAAILRFGQEHPNLLQAALQEVRSKPPITRPSFMPRALAGAVDAVLKDENPGTARTYRSHLLSRLQFLRSIWTGSVSRVG